MKYIHIIAITILFSNLSFAQSDSLRMSLDDGNRKTMTKEQSKYMYYNIEIFFVLYNDTMYKVITYPLINKDTCNYIILTKKNKHQWFYKMDDVEIEYTLRRCLINKKSFGKIKGQRYKRIKTTEYHSNGNKKTYIFLWNFKINKRS